MIVLNGSTQSLVIKSNATASVTEPYFTATYATIVSTDYTSITNVDSMEGQTSGTSDVDLVAAPSGSNECDIKYISIHNDDTATHVITILKEVGASQYDLWHCTLSQNQSATYADGIWTVYDTDGAVLQKSQLQSHGSTHQNGGSDEINVAGLSGLLADAQTPLAHKTSHENGGSDEISVAGLSGLLADGQTPLAHKTSHENGGTDEISVAGLSGLLADGQTPLAHAASHQNGGADEINVAGLSGLLADAQTPLSHASSHEDGGSDEINVTNLSGKLFEEQNPDICSQPTDATPTPATDYVVVDDCGSNGLRKVLLANIPVNTHAASHQNGGSDEISVAGLSGLLADAQTPLSHAASHQNGGSDEISVAGLSGLLADAQTPLSHAASHQNGGSDEISVAGLSGLLADAQTPTTHAASHQNGGSDEINVTNLSGKLFEEQDPDICSQPTDITPDPAVDYVVVDDCGSNGLRKVLIQDIIDLVPPSTTDICSQPELEGLPTPYLLGEEYLLTDDCGTTGQRKVALSALVGSGEAGGRLIPKTAATPSSLLSLQNLDNAERYLVYNPCVSNYILLRVDTNINKLCEIATASYVPSLDATTLTDATNYDVFAYLGATSQQVELEAVAWTNSTTRATALAADNTLIAIKSGDATRRLVGTVRIKSLAAVNYFWSALDFRFVANFYNVRPMEVFKNENNTTTSWTYQSTTVRAANADSLNSVNVVKSYPHNRVEIDLMGAYSASGTNLIHAAVGVGKDSTSAFAANQTNTAGKHQGNAPTDRVDAPLHAHYDDWDNDVGFHTYYWLEQSYATAATTFLGYTATALYLRTGITGTFWG